MDEENADDTSYVAQAVYDNLFGMMNFIRGRKGAKPLQEIDFYGEIDSFIEITNAISSFNVPANMLSQPGNITSTLTAQYDFSKFANAIGALYSRNKELEHINLLEATSSKASQGSGKFGLACLGSAVLAAALVGGACAVTGIINNNLNAQINDYRAKIDDPQMQKDLATVDARDAMLTGFKNYNDTVAKTSLLFNYKPKPQSLVLDKLRTPLEDDEFLQDDEELVITNFNCSGYSVSVTLMGASKGDADPSSIPSRYAEYLMNKVMNQYDDPYFVNVSYNGFQKLNPAEDLDDMPDETIFSFNMSMQLQMGSDEEHTNVNDDLMQSNPAEENSGTEVAQ